VAVKSPIWVMHQPSRPAATVWIPRRAHNLGTGSREAPRQTALRGPMSDVVLGATVGDMGPGVCKVRGSYLPIQPRGSTAWPFPRASQVAKASRGPRGATSCPSGPRAASPRGPRPTAMWRGERAGRRPRLNHHQCARRPNCPSPRLMQ
jgi:hypothetical protein